MGWAEVASKKSRSVILIGFDQRKDRTVAQFQLTMLKTNIKNSQPQPLPLAEAQSLGSKQSWQ